MKPSPYKPADRKAKLFAIEAHAATNHYYDEYLPYEFHLRMVVQVFKDFRIVAANVCEAYYSALNAKYERGQARPEFELITVYNIEDGCWLHDTIEDVRVNYNDIMWLYNDADQMAGDREKDCRVAEIVRAVTNITRGRSRSERMPIEVYDDIRNTPGATFVKLCDRIANVQYSKMSRSSMFKKYKKENEAFLQNLDGFELNLCKPLVDRLNKIFESED